MRTIHRSRSPWPDRAERAAASVILAAGAAIVAAAVIVYSTDPAPAPGCLGLSYLPDYEVPARYYPPMER